MRAGGHALSLLAGPLNAPVLEALEDRPRSLTDLRGAVGSPPQTTIRAHLGTLGDLGTLERRRQSAFPGALEYGLKAPGRELLAVANLVRTWLEAAPDGPLQLGSSPAKSAIKALVEGWSSNIVRALAARPLALTDLNRLIPGLNYPSLERRLGAMRLNGLIEARPGKGRGTPYMATDWLRFAIDPLAAAARWEQRHIASDTPSIDRIDVESMFLLTVPLMKLGGGTSGTGRLAAEVNGADAPAGVLIRVEQGRVVSCVSRLSGDADGWVLGTAVAWLGALIEDDAEALEAGGDRELTSALLEGLRQARIGGPNVSELHRT